MTETGWGEFDIIIKIFFVTEASEKPVQVSHHLKLHPWPAAPVVTVPSATSPPPLQPPSPPEPILSPIHSWQYEELVFSEPTETFYSLLLSKTPTPLPKSNRHPRALAYALSGGGNIGEFSTDMEKEEADRFEDAKRKTVAEIELLRAKLIASEKELTGEFTSWGF